MQQQQGTNTPTPMAPATPLPTMEAEIDDAVDADNIAQMDDAVDVDNVAELDEYTSSIDASDTSVNNYGMDALTVDQQQQSQTKPSTGETKGEKNVIVIVACAVSGFVFLSIVAICVLNRKRKSRLHISNIDPTRLNNQQALNTLTHEEIDAHIV